MTRHLAVSVPAGLLLACIVVQPTVARSGGAKAGQCSNTCTTMAIPASADGVRTRLDGWADATLWPPDRGFRTIHISALDARDTACKVTITDVRQDEALATDRRGVDVADATNCSNARASASVDLRSERDQAGDGRMYHVAIRMEDPRCAKAARTDEVLVAVPREETAAPPKVEADASDLRSSYAGDSLQCRPHEADRYASIR
ncbi:MAG TPA: hypothetical protein VGK20_03570 [Candidatus Binatia bacterium]|jgi:hypothetical protein